MNTEETIKSALIALLDQFVYIVSSSRQMTKEDSVNNVIIPILLEHLRPLGARVLTKEDYESIVNVTENLPASKNVKKILKEYNTSILEIMQGVKYEANE